MKPYLFLKSGRLPIRAVVGMILMSSLVGLFSHEGPEQVIQNLNREIRVHGISPERLYQRATEHRVLGNLEAAAADLRVVLEQSPKHAEARSELARVYLALSRPAQAGLILEEMMGAGSEIAGDHYMIRAQVHMARGRLEAALRDCHSALALLPDKLDWYLIRSRLQSKLNRTSERVTGLAEGYRMTGSYVLHEQWIEAVMDDGQHEKALALIENELKWTRWKSAWWLRRAQVHLAQGKKALAAQDSQLALAELELRLRPENPDLTLVVEQGLALALSGKVDEAEAALERARGLGASPWMTERLTDFLGNNP